MGFPGFQGISLGVNGFYRVSRGFPRGLTRCYWVLLGIIGFHLIFLD